MLPFAKSSELLTISYSHENFMMIAQTIGGLTTHYVQGRRHGFESGGDNFASGASKKIFLTHPLFGQWGGQNIA